MKRLNGKTEREGWLDGPGQKERTCFRVIMRGPKIRKSEIRKKGVFTRRVQKFVFAARKQVRYKIEGED